MSKIKLPETKIKPLDFKNELGNPRSLYSTTIDGMLYGIFIFSILFGFIGTVVLISIIAGINNVGNAEALYLIFGIAIAYYIYIGNRYRYIATFDEGFVIKMRFRYKVILYKDIKMIRYHNISPIFNLFRRGFRKEIAIDIFLNNNDFVTIGNSKRLFESTRYPRIRNGIRILDIDKLYEELIITTNLIN